PRPASRSSSTTAAGWSPPPPRCCAPGTGCRSLSPPPPAPRPNAACARSPARASWPTGWASTAASAKGREGRRSPAALAFRRLRRWSAPGDDPRGLDRHDHAGVAGVVPLAEVRAAVLGAELVGERVVVVRGDLRVAAQLDVPVRTVRVEDEEADLGVRLQVLHLLPGGVQRDLHGVAFGEEPGSGQLRPPARSDGAEHADLRVEQALVRVRNLRSRHGTNFTTHRPRWSV